MIIFRTSGLNIKRSIRCLKKMGLKRNACKKKLCFLIHKSLSRRRDFATAKDSHMKHVGRAAFRGLVSRTFGGVESCWRT